MTRTVKQRIVYFITVEGESERSFIKWIQMQCDQEGLRVHLNCIPLNGGGYERMLDQTIAYQKRHLTNKNKAGHTLMIVDADRAMRGDEHWSQEKLRKEASKYNITVCFQNPNYEGILLKMLTRKGNTKLNGQDSKYLLEKKWRDYKKGADAYALLTKFTVEDLLFLKNSDEEFQKLFDMIGLFCN